ncbi:MAG: hypothetical protein AMXMBFR84_26210 [Candidatus Hydrogenedentota bacterium]
MSEAKSDKVNFTGFTVEQRRALNRLLSEAEATIKLFDFKSGFNAYARGILRTVFSGVDALLKLEKGFK